MQSSSFGTFGYKHVRIGGYVFENMLPVSNTLLGRHSAVASGSAAWAAACAGRQFEVQQARAPGHGDYHKGAVHKAACFARCVYYWLRTGHSWLRSYMRSFPLGRCQDSKAELRSAGRTAGCIAGR